MKKLNLLLIFLGSFSLTMEANAAKGIRAVTYNCPHMGDITFNFTSPVITASAHGFESPTNINNIDATLHERILSIVRQLPNITRGDLTGGAGNWTFTCSYEASTSPTTTDLLWQFTAANITASTCTLAEDTRSVTCY